jgi:hypothetical protein
MFSDLFEIVHFAYIFCAAVLFISGIYTAPYVVDKNLKWLLVYPRWVAGLMEKYFSVNWGFFIIFSIIFTLNNLSLFSGLLSGFLIILPFILTFLTGLHVAVIGYDLMGWKGIWHLLVNPVAWLEFPAAWVSFGMGIKLSVTILSTNLKKGVEIFQLLLPLYLKYVMVLLAIAALIETAFIIWAEKQKNK